MYSRSYKIDSNFESVIPEPMICAVPIRGRIAVMVDLYLHFLLLCKKLVRLGFMAHQPFFHVNNQFPVCTTCKENRSKVNKKYVRKRKERDFVVIHHREEERAARKQVEHQEATRCEGRRLCIYSFQSSRVCP